MSKTTKNKTTVSLVLGSGGARGLAHIGVIHWLEENNFKIESISGCSMGALIGGVYAAGKLDDFEQWVGAITKVDILALLDLAWRKDGLIKGDKIIGTLTDLVGDQLIEDLPFSYTAVAADVNKLIWQYFVNYNFDDGWYLTSTPIMSADWTKSSGEQWTVPVGGGVGKLMKFESFPPLDFKLQAFTNVVRPAGAAEWSAMFSVKLILPKALFAGQ